MKRTKLLILHLLLLNVIILPQIRTLPTLDHFDYPLGNLGATYPASGWVVDDQGNDLLVVAGNLASANYPMPATGNRIQISNAGEDDYKLQFTNVSNGKIYASFLLNVINSTGLGNAPDGDVIGGLGDFSNSFATTRIWITNGSIPGTNYNLGLSKNNNEEIGYSGNLSFGTTYLVVVSYEFVDPVNDIVSLWVNPDLSGPEPPATISGVGIDAVDSDNIDAFFLRQSPGVPDLYMDGLRIGINWTEAPLPVELSSLSAAIIGSTVKLNWMTETEVNNYGFEIHRFAENDKNGWTKIGFVQGNGNSNSPKYYSFEDENLIAGEYSYRLKQIDTDGQFEYSKVVEVNFGSPMKYELSQNYPNPFNPVTTIQFSIPEAIEVNLTIYNILGEEVAELVNGVKEAGVYTVNFNASELNSGLYIYKLSAGNFTQVKKLMVVK